MTMVPHRCTAEDRAHLAAARATAGRAQAPPVGRCGAIAVTRDGRAHCGATMQLTGAPGLSACAEQIALSAARAAGDEPIERLYLWVPEIAPPHPCGRCLQVWRELAPEAPGLLQRGDGEPEPLDLDALLPDPFTRY